MLAAGTPGEPGRALGQLDQHVVDEAELVAVLADLVDALDVCFGREGLEVRFWTSGELSWDL